MNTDDVARWLVAVGLEMYVDMLRAKAVNGARLASIAANYEEMMVSVKYIYDDGTGTVMVQVR